MSIAPISAPRIRDRSSAATAEDTPTVAQATTVPSSAYPLHPTPRDVIDDENQLMIVVTVEDFDADTGLGHPPREQAN